ncbi:VOC family protein [Arthrobacter castelli]|uniref:VOC family protein n=1 Tax=Arthrobacter castelli TaxID=271431 RepID=UPI000401F54A|nr:VOC family protein [Arthrobacter castelli]
MSVMMNSYLNFRDTTREAMQYYHSVFGGQLELNTFAEFQASEDPSEQDKIMHSVLTTDQGHKLMAADTPNGMEYKPGSAHSLSLSGDDEALLRGYWEKLSDGGTVTLPLEKAPWGDTFGMCTDRFGTSWMVDIAGEEY